MNTAGFEIRGTEGNYENWLTIDGQRIARIGTTATEAEATLMLITFTASLNVLAGRIGREAYNWEQGTGGEWQTQLDFGPLRKCTVCDGQRRTARYGRKELGEPHIVREDCYRCAAQAMRDGKIEVRDGLVRMDEPRDCGVCGNDPEYVERCTACGGSGKQPE